MELGYQRGKIQEESLHYLNGKVERSQLTDLQEFWAHGPCPSMQDSDDLECWQFDYNWRRPHGSLKGRTPAERSSELCDQIPDREAVALRFDDSKEPLQFSNWATDQAMKMVHFSGAKRKRSLQENVD